MITTEELSRFPDTFNGDDEHLVRCIEALLSLDATGTLVPHGIGGHARGLLSAAMHRLASQSRAAGVQGAGDESARLAALWDSEAAKLERGGVNQPNYDKGLASGLRQCSSNLRDSISRQSRLATLQPPKDAGAVPMPDAEFSVLQNGRLSARTAGYVPHLAQFYTADQLREYGDAREAAGRADVVPIQFLMDFRADVLTIKDNPNKGDAVFRCGINGAIDVVVSRIDELIAAAQVPQHPPAEPAARAQSGDALHDAMERTIARSSPETQAVIRGDAHPSPAHAGAGDAEALAREVGSYQSEITGPGGRGERFTFTRAQFAEFARRLAGGDHA